jgi:N,N'-diacetyllegionaminate synthase
MVWIVAEVGNNHEGSVDSALRMIDAAQEAGADAVKFQTFKTESFVAVDATPSERVERLRKFELSQASFSRLFDHARSVGIECFSTPLDPQSAAFLAGCASRLKLASGDNDCRDFVELLASFRLPLIVSTGMLDLEGVRRLVNWVKAVWSAQAFSGNLSILHCVSAYPAPADQLNLNVIRQLEHEFSDCVVGYSDHCMGIEASVAAVAVGARVIEKHFTLSKTTSDFRDHQLSADPAEFKEMVRRIRELEAILGSPKKRVQPAELPVLEAARRSLAASRDLAVGERMDKGSRMWLRPSSGVSSEQFDAMKDPLLKVAVAKGKLIPRDAI